MRFATKAKSVCVANTLRNLMPIIWQVIGKLNRAERANMALFTFANSVEFSPMFAQCLQVIF